MTTVTPPSIYSERLTGMNVYPLHCAPASPARRTGSPPTAPRVAPSIGLPSGGSMTDNLAWRDAMTVAGSLFTPEQHSAGWPRALRDDQLATLQRPWARGDKVARARCDALHQAIVSACKEGALPHTTETIEPQPVPAVRRAHPIVSDYELLQRINSGTGGGFAGARLGGSGWGDGSTSGLPARVVPTAIIRKDQATSSARTCFVVTASHFFAWLAKQGDEPSPHISAWFRACGLSAVVPSLPREQSRQASSEREEQPQIYKKKALVAALQDKWPTIEADLNQASKNGLSEAARARGGWELVPAEAWAESKGRIKKPAPAAALQAVWPGQPTPQKKRQ